MFGYRLTGYGFKALTYPSCSMILASSYYYGITIEWHDRSPLVHINTTVQYSNYSVACRLTL